MLDDSMLRMQQEAVERVRQMQERARKYVEKDFPPAEEIPVKTADPHPESQTEALARKNLSFLSGLGEDKDQLLLLMLAVLLVKSNASIELVLALLYIAM